MSLLAAAGVVLMLAAPGGDDPSGGDDGTSFGADAAEGGFLQWAKETHVREQAVQENVPSSTSYNGWAVPSVSVGVPVTIDGPDGMCVVTDDVAPVAGLVPCDDRPGDEEPAEDDEAEDAPDEPAPVIITVSASDFAELPLVPGGVQIQPENRSWTAVNIDTIAYTSGDPQVLSTQVLGFDVAVRATPVEFAWDFGDGSDPLVTTDPGLPYPDHTVSHIYAAAAEEVSVALTTTWVGEFQVAAQGPWIPIAGTAQTTSVSDPFSVEEIRTRLVPAPVG
ncbi:PKD domain-containing protein [Ruania suaedae]|uniref:PKD domain-containing protein n=1 Tax=Ruania suaedae TaxID=2897774 RepID=UPI001E378B7D|nr:PKD domain-containing protein [Ruania suaedae]UFU01822.1 PKD domain-containing protein [Ruania suaedae]